MVTILPLSPKNLDLKDEKELLLSKYITCVDCTEVQAQQHRTALKRDSSGSVHAPTTKRRKLRRALHHHKTSNAYQNAPVLENPCPLCFFRQCRKVLRKWLRKQKKPFSAVTVQIDRLTSEQYEENVSPLLHSCETYSNDDLGSWWAC